MLASSCTASAVPTLSSCARTPWPVFQSRKALIAVARKVSAVPCRFCTVVAHQRARRRSQHASTYFWVWMACAPRLRISWRAVKSSWNLRVTICSSSRAQPNALIANGSWIQVTPRIRNTNRNTIGQTVGAMTRIAVMPTSGDRQVAHEEEPGALHEAEDVVEVADDPRGDVARELAVVVVDAEPHQAPEDPSTQGEDDALRELLGLDAEVARDEAREDADERQPDRGHLGGSQVRVALVADEVAHLAEHEVGCDLADREEEDEGHGGEEVLLERPHDRPQRPERVAVHLVVVDLGPVVGQLEPVDHRRQAGVDLGEARRVGAMGVVDADRRRLLGQVGVQRVAPGSLGDRWSRSGRGPAHRPPSGPRRGRRTSRLRRLPSRLRRGGVDATDGRHRDGLVFGEQHRGGPLCRHLALDDCVVFGDVVGRLELDGAVGEVEQAGAAGDVEDRGLGEELRGRAT